MAPPPSPERDGDPSRGEPGPQPLFIGGPHRSGTGMVRAILGSNSQLALPPKEYQFFDTPPVRGNDDWARAPETVLAAILDWPKLREWGLAPGSAEAMLAASDRSPGAIYAAPLRAYAAAAGKPRFGEKTPYLERRFETLLAWFGPGLRFVQLIRDPIPTYVSLCHQGGARQVIDPLRFARSWRSSALRGLDHARRFPAQFMLVPYEEFTQAPAAWTRRLCDFAGLPHEIEAMLAMKDFARKRNSSFGEDAPGGTNHVGEPAGHPAPSRLDAWIIAHELGPLRDGIGGLADEELPLDLIGAEERGKSSVAARASVLTTRAWTRLIQRA
ncbi:sulfotransferase [Sphingomonas sp. LB-2]|uniref:sulfotransferase family protein n=1 Tax=Sphingomonas caeni TaxID=2984949 RepID=UPI002231F300|nr:sulfotransferase [Sphingomonas caeni]MCW3846631.1 sulfotransferase [Sphingomonas caeni]